MLTGYRRLLVLGYLLNVASKIRPQTNEAKEFANSLREITDELEIEIPELEERDSELTSSGTPERDIGPSTRDWQKIHKALRRERRKLRSQQPDELARRIQELAALVGLNKTDIAILNYFLHYETDPTIEHLVDEMVRYKKYSIPGFSAFSVLNSMIARLLGVSRGFVRERLAIDSPMVQSGIISLDEDGEISVLRRLRRLSYEPSNSGRHIQQVLFEKAPSSELEWRDFDHVASGRDHIERLIVGALSTGEKGVNILIHGPPGTGKTEFCKTLAERLDVNLFSVGESDEGGREPSRTERLQELRLTDRILGESRDSVLLFDEMEDLLAEQNFSLGWEFRGLHRRTRGSQGSKVFMHRLLEQNAVPILWTSNSARQTNPTLLRRMMYALELRQPSVAIRKRIWRRQLERHGIPSSNIDAEKLASDFDVTPGVVDRAVAGARLIESGGISSVFQGVESLSRLLNGPKPPKENTPDFDLSLVCANTDLIELSERLTALKRRPFSLCLQGPPGTGKSAFVRYLGNCIGLEIVQKRASDLLSMWVGETEKQIAEAFADAREQEQFLVFDEADSLLADRRFAHRNWEISQVNEMLTWMESHPLPFACTTNYDEHLDPATLRRFNFKLRFNYLSPDRVKVAFKSFFDLNPPTDLETLSNLTPGDFEVVKRQAEVLGKLNDLESLVQMLEHESESKPERVYPIGFRSGYA